MIITFLIFSFRIVIGEVKIAGQYQRSSHVIQVIK
jgi:hypothetical protein